MGALYQQFECRFSFSPDNNSECENLSRLSEGLSESLLLIEGCLEGDASREGDLPWVHRVQRHGSGIVVAIFAHSTVRA